MKTSFLTLLAFFAIFTSSVHAATADTDIVLQKEQMTSSSLTISIHVKNPSHQEIKAVQSWLQFDPNVLKGVKIDADTSPFDFVAPGENNFDNQTGIVKIGRSTMASGITVDDIFVANVQFERLSTKTTEISFYNFKVGSDSNTSVRVFEDGFPVNVLQTEPQKLIITGGGTDSGAKNTVLASAPAKEAVKVTETKAPVIIDRPQAIRITSGPEYIIASWDAVEGAAGYNIYYSNTSGRYLQRRSTGNVNEYYLDHLKTGEVYYFAVTAYKSAREESDYSNEVRIRVGYPQSSSAPLLFTKSENIIKNAKSNVKSGPEGVFALITFLSAFGTFLFVKRQKI